MTDGDIRHALRANLLEQHRGDRSTILIEELGLRHGAVRADVVVVNGLLHGFEIKSDLDTLRRLPRQVEYYSSVLARATLVVGYRLLDRALTLLPGWWGVILAKPGKEIHVELDPIRRAEENPQLSPLALAKLLWREEALTALRYAGAADGLSSKPRAHLYQRLADTTDLRCLQSLVCAALKARTSWRPAAPQM
jgi:hypothetical protein